MVERISLALETPVGLFLVVLVGLLACLLVVYGVIVLNKRRKDVYRHRNAAYFAAAEEAIAEYRVVGPHHGVFFGRETHVQDSAGHHFLCLIFPPENVSDAVCSRFWEYLHALEESWPQALAAYRFVNTDQRFLVVQEKPLMPLNAYVRDKRFTMADKEKVLMTIAEAMVQLHHAQLYHGFLLPTSIFLETDAAHRLTRVIIADAGFVYALGAEKIQHEMQGLQQGKLPIEKYRREELLSLLPMLAPEQRDKTKLSMVGTPADFYTFASLALYLFTGQKGMVKWEQVPERWRPFLERCLHPHPAERPVDFQELQEWVEDPDVALTIHSGDLDLTLGVQNGSVVEMMALAETIHHDYVDTVPQKKARRRSGESLADCLAAGASAMKMGRWEVAKGHYDAALTIEDHHPEALLKLAVCVFELGDMKSAEHYLNAAAACDPSATKAFQQHIAFRI